MYVVFLTEKYIKKECYSHLILFESSTYSSLFRISFFSMEKKVINSKAITKSSGITMRLVIDCIVVSTFNPGTNCSKQRIPNGKSNTKNPQKTLYQLAGSSSFLRFLDVNVATTVDAAVAPQAKVTNTTTIYTTIAIADNGRDCKTASTATLFPLSMAI